MARGFRAAAYGSLVVAAVVQKLEPGTLFGDRYRLERIVGEGGMGIVWAATHELTKKPIALKFVKHAADAAKQRARVLREARASCAVRHPNVREVFDILEDDEQMPVMAMEYLVGESLGDKLRREKVVELAELAAIALPVLSAVGAAHALGIVHRDLKPENIFLVEEGPVRVKVLDFGIAKLTALEGEAAVSGAITATGALLGTPFYMAPEQAFGEKDIDHRADTWALGLILYRCLAGTLPTEADNVGQVFKNIVANPIKPLGELRPELPADVTSIIGRMLARARDRRPNDLHEVVDVLAPHTGVACPSFGPPTARSVALEGARTEPPAAAEEDASALVDPMAKTEDARDDRAAPSARAARSSNATPSTRRRWLFAAAVMASIAVGSIWLAASSGAPAPAAPSKAAASSPEEQVTRATSRAREPTPPASATSDSTAPATSSSPSPVPSVAPSHAPVKPGHAATGRAATSAASSVPSPSKPPEPVPVQKDW